MKASEVHGSLTASRRGVCHAESPSQSFTPPVTITATLGFSILARMLRIRMRIT